MTWALLVEIYGQYDMKFFEAITELNKQVGEPESPQAQPEPAPPDAASLAVLQAMMRDSDFQGPKG